MPVDPSRMRAGGIGALVFEDGSYGGSYFSPPTQP